MGNIFSIFPISGIFSKSSEKLKFRLLYPIAIYSMIVQFFFMSELVLLFIFLSNSGLKFFMVGEWTALNKWRHILVNLNEAHFENTRKVDKFLMKQFFESKMRFIEFFDKVKNVSVFNHFDRNCQGLTLSRDRNRETSPPMSCDAAL